MSITLDACKPVPAGKSTGAFNGQTQSSTPYGGKPLSSRCQEKPLSRTAGNRTSNRHR